ncbi:MAG: TauD/TfdA dioxygenase family protein [Thiolinea sp.]
MSQADFVAPFRFESQASYTDYNHFQARPLNGAIGAEITDVDLSTADKEVLQELEQALLNHLVLVIRDQHLSAPQLAAIGRHFGNLHINPFVAGNPDAPEVIEIRSEENDDKRFTGLWHSDISWGKTPSLGALLHAVKLPEYGGETLFANMYLAYETLSDGMKTMLAPLRAEHRVDIHKSFDSDYADMEADSVLHPVIRTHPATGRKLLFINEYFTSRFENMTRDESKPLLDYLCRHAVRADFSCRVQWQPNTLVFWDNRCTQHYATNDYLGQPRLMHRVTINGDKPY